MIQAKYIQKFRDKSGKIIGYRLQDNSAKTVDVTSEQLKQAIKNNQIHILNLTLTQDNRLVNTSITDDKSSTLVEKVIVDGDFIKVNYCNYIDLGNCKLKTVPKMLYGANIKFISLIDKKTLNDLCNKYKSVHTNDLYIFKRGNTAIIASEKQICLADIPKGHCGCGMFGEMYIKSIDLRSVDTSEVTSMQGLFSNCDAEKYILDGLDMSNVTSYGYMFYRSNARRISMKNVKINKNAYMGYMFGEIGDFDIYTDNSIIQKAYDERIW